MKRQLYLLGLVICFGVFSVEAQTNSWTNSTSGKWEDAASWSLGALPNYVQAAIITNAISKTVSIDTDSMNGSNSLSVLALTLGGPIGTTNVLSLFDFGDTQSFVVGTKLQILAGGALTITNSRLQVDGLAGGVGLDVQEVVEFQSGVVVVSNSGVQVTGAGHLIMDDGYLLTSDMEVGAPTLNSGTLTLAGGTLSTFYMRIGGALGTTGRVWVTGGQISAFILYIASNGVSQVTVSNGLCKVAHLTVGLASKASGALSINGGAVVASNMYIGRFTGSTGEVWVCGGELDVTNTPTSIGSGAVGKLSVSNGILRALGLNLTRGKIAISGGNSMVFSNLLVGSGPCSSTGLLTVAGGALFVTNATVDATLEIRSGSLHLSGGVLQVDRLVITNSCAQFSRTGGTLIYSNAVLDPIKSVVGDGIPNGWKQQYGLDPFDPNLGNKDADGDGFSNLQEYLAGTNPTNTVSGLRITGTVRTNDDILVTWTTVGGHTNVVQVASDLTAGYTNLSPNLIVPGSTETTTNYLDLGGATNGPSRFYRVRLVP